MVVFTVDSPKSRFQYDSAVIPRKSYKLAIQKHFPKMGRFSMTSMSYCLRLLFACFGFGSTQNQQLSKHATDGMLAAIVKEHGTEGKGNLDSGSPHGICRYRGSPKSPGKP
jgi:hypothetical protein